MKNKIFSFQTLVAVMLSVVMSIAFTSCSDNDDDSSTDNLSSILIGTWSVQDPDDDSSDSQILKINSYKNGVFEGVWDDEDPYAFRLEKKNGYYESKEDLEIWHYRPISVSQNQIIWHVYDADQYDNPNFNKNPDNPEYNLYFLKDEYGYYYADKWVRVI